MNHLHNSTARLCICALGLSFSLPSPALAQVQTTAASRQARSAPASREVAGDEAIRPFRVRVPDADIADLRRRIAATRWPDKETVADQSQGAQLAKLRELVRYWGTDYNWRKAEAKLNAYPQFETRIDGLDIHFIHVRSRHPTALPLIITHGWPGSVFEQIKLVDPLTDPTKYGGRAEDAFDVVIPSLPGFGFSERPAEAGWGLDRIGRAWTVLMDRLGYTRYVAQGGDWGAGVVEEMGRRAPAAGLAGWMLVHGGFAKWTYGTDPNQSPTRDDVLDNFSLYWLTNTAASSARIYWESRNLKLTSAASIKTNEISVPVAITVFPDEVIRAQETWARRAFPNLIYFHEADRGGHFAMWEYPELFAAELRAAFKPLR
jgi:pimeloyl-ACP methyl ester carboxylesterase